VCVSAIVFDMAMISVAIPWCTWYKNPGSRSTKDARAIDNYGQSRLTLVSRNRRSCCINLQRSGRGVGPLLCLFCQSDVCSTVGSTHPLTIQRDVAFGFPESSTRSRKRDEVIPPNTPPNNSVASCPGVSRLSTLVLAWSHSDLQSYDKEGQSLLPWDVPDRPLKVETRVRIPLGLPLRPQSEPRRRRDETSGRPVSGPQL
jgi:hypothetical protein